MCHVFDREIRNMESWLTAPRVVETVYETAVRELESRIASKVLAPQDYGHIKVSLNRLALWNKTRAIVAASKHSGNASTALQHGLLLDFWATRISVRQYDLDVRPQKATWGLMANNAALLL